METNIGGYHRVRWARGVLIPSPCVTDFRTLILWSQDPVPYFVRFSDIPFPYGINILVATLLFIFASVRHNVLHKIKKKFQPQVAAVTPVVNSAPAYQSQVSQQQIQQRSQQPQQQVRPPNYNNRAPRYPAFDPIPMPYADLFPTLLAKGLIQTRSQIG